MLSRPVNNEYTLQDQFLTRFFSSSLAPAFYLTGGTALARFYFHHRESLDLDLFTNEQEQDFDSVNRTILSILADMDLRISSQVATGTFLQYIVKNVAGVPLKIDVVKDVPIHFGAFQMEHLVRLDSLENIGSNKVLAVFGRTDAKDFIDLYWILHHTPLTFDHLFQCAKQKDLGLSELYLAYALENVSRIKLFPRMLVPLAWDDIKTYFQELARALLLRIKPEQ
jgi:predicted nucleotidyltransferase component of viral defense system